MTKSDQFQTVQESNKPKKIQKSNKPKNNLKITTKIANKLRLEADGKPSTWFPPGRLVEHIF